MSRANLVWLLALPAVTVFGLVFTFAAPDPDKDYQLVRKLADVLATVDKNYVRKLSDDDKQKLVEDMIQGGLYRLDEHSAYFNEQQLAAFDTTTDGEFGGIGIHMDLEASANADWLIVQTPIPHTPAYDAGFQPGDHILAINGKSTKGLRPDESRKLITGKPGTEVKLTARRGAGTLPAEDIVLKRAMIDLHGVDGVVRSAADPTKWDYFPDPAAKVAYIRVNTFNAKTVKELKAALDAVKAQGARALVFDLRDNPGGLLTEAREMAELFLADGVIVSTRVQDEITRVWKATDGGSPFERPADMPMAVLVNHDSASASEIVAAALQDNKRAVLVGERTYGKGSVQKVFNLSDNRTAVKLTFEEWLTPNGKNIHRAMTDKKSDVWGVLPDAGFEVKVDEAEWKKYVAFRRAVDVIPGKPGVAPVPAGGDKPRRSSPQYDDPVIKRAVDHLKQKLGGVGARRLPRSMAS
jgi:carboxyl-terminal processing protease